MNLFCFTLEGSTESVYEAPYRPAVKHHLSPEWGGSDPDISSNTRKAKRNNRRSCLPAASCEPPSENKTLDKDMTLACWMSAGDRSHFSHHMKEMCRTSCESRDREETQTHLPAQGSETTAESAQSTGRLKKLQNLVQTKKGPQSGADGNNSPVLTCMGLGRRAEKKPSTAPSVQQQPQRSRSVHGDTEEDRVWSPEDYPWSPFECPQPWIPSYHTCRQAQHKLSLPRTTEWDRFESLIQELDSRESDLCPPQMIRSITDLQLSHNTLNRFGRFDALRQPSPVMTAWGDGRCLSEQQEQNNHRVPLQRSNMDTSAHSDRKHINASTEERLTAISSGNMQKDEERKEVGGGQSFSKGRRRSTNSLESLYSLNSGQSSSSGVTSGSGCSSNRDSLRLDHDLLYTRQHCGRAVVHTDFTPSPYDTESLKLKVGDVIDIMTKPPMGIWTGMLNGRVGSFKFIYVDVLTEESPDTDTGRQSHTARHRSTVQEVLKHLSMEEHFLSLQLNGYQTVDDLMRLREHHLTELNVTDPEHRHRLLAAVDSLQQLCSESQSDGEAIETPSERSKAEMNNRDSGCLMLPDSADSSTEEPVIYTHHL